MGMHRLFKAFRWFALAFVVVWSLANVAHLASKVTRRNPLEDPSVIASYDKKFRPIREQLLGMKGLHRIGFVQDLQPSKDYNLTQYALAPIVLTLDPRETEYAIGSFSSTAIENRMLPGFEMVRDWGNGIILFKRLD